MKKLTSVLIMVRVVTATMILFEFAYKYLAHGDHNWAMFCAGMLLLPDIPEGHPLSEYKPLEKQS